MTASDPVNNNDIGYLARAIALARRGLETTDPNPRVGCVLVREGSVVGEGWHERAGGPHAEVNALSAAGDKARGATAYVSLEPCCHHGRTPPCTDALLKAGIQRVVFGARDPNPRVNGGGEKALQSAGITVTGGLLAAEAEALNAGFVSRMRRGRPLVRVKVAASLDGRTALADGQSQWITSEASRRDVQRWRARSSAVLTGIGTVLADNPRLDVREGIEPIRQPLRVIVDSALRTPANATLFATPGPVLIVATTDPDRRAAELAAKGARVEILPGEQVPLAALMELLGRLEINEVWVEAGPRLNGALLQAGLVDELIVYQAPRVLGDAGKGMFSLPAPATVAASPEFTLTDSRRIGGDLRLHYRPVSSAEAKGS